ncbi:hypothetical protein TDB9533_03807 [Thalassocella blandensis]|nr:hypothetical protein TDB9533_03807 [Thalassocella blandensis]
MDEEFKPWGQDIKSFCVLMHLSQFAGMLLPGAGIVLPIVMWVTNKEKSLVLDNHGRVIVNWILSTLIYTLICLPLCALIIGFFGLFLLVILNFIFIILGAVKANDDELWVYPLSIRFFKLRDEFYIER